MWNRGCPDRPLGGDYMYHACNNAHGLHLKERTPSGFRHGLRQAMEVWILF